MTLSPNARRLCWHGVLLLLIGLLNGAVVQQFANPRMGLSSHLAGVQNGMLLILFGLLWRHVTLPAGRERLAVWAAVFSMYAIWLALALGAALGTSGATPIAGAGYAGQAWQEALVTGLLYAGSGAILLAVVLVLLGLRAPRS